MTKHAPFDNKPFDQGYVRTSDGGEIYWEASGNPHGTPALYLHGGPGSGLGSGSYRHRFDPERYMVVGIDQRGCGRSSPLAAEPLGSLTENTTQRLISDIELVREHLEIDQWLVAGMSWGTTLALAYAITRPEAVSALVLAAVTTTSRSEVDWITEGVGKIFPEAWERFERASGRRANERVVDAYARRLANATLNDRMSAAMAWSDWEDTQVSLDPSPGPSGVHRKLETTLLSATLVTHYWSNDAFLRGDDAILSNTKSIEHIPIVLIHGRQDFGSPLITAWTLHQQLPASRLVIVETEGHGGPRISMTMRLALDQFAQKMAK